MRFLDGRQPRFTQVPPRVRLSVMAAVLPSSAARIAAANAVEPEPRMTRSSLCNMGVVPPFPRIRPTMVGRDAGEASGGASLAGGGAPRRRGRRVLSAKVLVVPVHVEGLAPRGSTHVVPPDDLVGEGGGPHQEQGDPRDHCSKRAAHRVHLPSRVFTPSNDAALPAIPYRALGSRAGHGDERRRPSRRLRWHAERRRVCRGPDGIGPPGSGTARVRARRVCEDAPRPRPDDAGWGRPVRPRTRARSLLWVTGILPDPSGVTPRETSGCLWATGCRDGVPVFSRRASPRGCVSSRLSLPQRPTRPAPGLTGGSRPLWGDVRDSAA